MNWVLCLGFMPGALPGGIGLDVSGLIDGVGEGVTNAHVGDRVFGVPDYMHYSTAGLATAIRNVSVRHGRLAHSSRIESQRTGTWQALDTARTGSISDAEAATTNFGSGRKHHAYSTMIIRINFFSVEENAMEEL